MNFVKSFVFFSSNVSTQLCTSLAREFGVRYSRNTKKYLGLLNVVGCNKKALFLGLKEHMQKKVNGWGAKFLSQ